MGFRYGPILLGWFGIAFLFLAGAIAVSLLVIAIWISFRTPFRMIDDYGDWEHVALFSSSGIRAWFSRNFIHSPDMRWRPLFEMSNAFTWWAFRTNGGLHHAFRWLQTFLTLSLLLQSQRLAFPREEQSADRPLFLSRFVLVFLFLLYPNCPYARLAPQEVSAVLFLSVANFVVLLVMRENRSSSFRERIVHVVCFSAALLFLAISKETCIAWLAVFVIFSLFSFVRLPRWEAVALTAVSVAVSVLSFWKIVAIVKTPADYGHAPVTMRLVLENACSVFFDSFLFRASGPLGAVLLFLAVFPVFGLLRKIWRPETESANAISVVDGYVALLWLEFAGMSTFLCLQWSFCLRYWYVLVPSIVSLTAVSVERLSERAVRNRPLVLFLSGTFCLFFVCCNGSQYLAQFSVQRDCGETERFLIRFIESELRQGRTVLLRVGQTKLGKPPEPLVKLLQSCGPFRKRFPEAGPILPLVIASAPPAELSANETYVSLWTPEIPVPTSEQIRIESPVKRSGVSSCYPAIRRLSASVQFRPSPYLSFDAGAVIRPDYSWFAVRGPVPRPKEIQP